MPAGRPKRMSIKVEKKKKEDFLEILQQNLGVITPSLKLAGITRWYYDQWLREDPNFKENVEGIREKTLDFVESKLFQLIEEKDKTAIIFYLKCKGKDRGYIEKQYVEQETTFKQPLTINVIPPQEQLESSPEPTQISHNDKKLLE